MQCTLSPTNAIFPSFITSASSYLSIPCLGLSSTYYTTPTYSILTQYDCTTKAISLWQSNDQYLSKIILDFSNRRCSSSKSYQGLGQAEMTEAAAVVATFQKVLLQALPSPRLSGTWWPGREKAPSTGQCEDSHVDSANWVAFGLEPVGGVAELAKTCFFPFCKSCC